MPGLQRKELIAAQALVLAGLLTGAASGYLFPTGTGPVPTVGLDRTELAGFLAGIGAGFALLLGTAIPWFSLDRAAAAYREGIRRGEVLLVVVGRDPRSTQRAEMVLLSCGAHGVRTGLAEGA
jgi:hypothetical protein